MAGARAGEHTGRVSAPPAPEARPPGLVAIYRRLSALAASPGTTPAAVTAALAAATGARVALVGPGLRVLAASVPDADDAVAAVAVRERIRGPRPAPWARVPGAADVPARLLRVPGPDGSLAVVAPVLVGDEVHSHLVAEYDPGGTHPDDDAVLLATEHAATVVGVLVGRDRVLSAAAGQVRADLVSGLLLGRARDRDQAARWAEHLGHESGSPHRVVIVAPLDAPDPDTPAAGPDPDGGARHALLAEAEEHLLRDAPAALTVVRETEVAAVVPVDADPAAVGAACARRLARGRTPDPDAQWPVTVAVGGEVVDPAALSVSYDQARRTLTAARRLGGTGRVLRFDDLGIHRLLLQIPDPVVARDFAGEVLGRLVGGADGRSERTTDVLRTLARWFREDGSLQRTARALSVHPNTVTYRLRRAEELSGLSLERYGDRLAAQVALEILGEMAG